MKLLVFLVSSLALSTLALEPNFLPNGDPVPVTSINLEQFAGRWYELGRLAYSFESKCSCSVVNFVIDTESTLALENVCNWGSPTGKTIQVAGRAVPQDPVRDYVTTGEWELEFFSRFHAPFYVFGLDQTYEWALLGSPNKKFLWILTRHPSVDDNLYELLANLAGEAGFDANKIVQVEQSAQCIRAVEF